MAHFINENLAQINEQFSKTNFLNEDLPGPDDVRMFNTFNGIPPKNQYPEIYFWYLVLNSFTLAKRVQWISVPEIKKQLKKEQVQKQYKSNKKQSNIDPFENIDIDLRVVKKSRAQAAFLKDKSKAIGKTILIFEFNIYEDTYQQASLEKIVKRIKNNINPDWKRDVNYKDIIYGVKKILMSMVIEDDKVFDLMILLYSN